MGLVIKREKSEMGCMNGGKIGKEKEKKRKKALSTHHVPKRGIDAGMIPSQFLKTCHISLNDDV